jgi:hypothetical protein
MENYVNIMQAHYLPNTRAVKAVVPEEISSELESANA